MINEILLTGEENATRSQELCSMLRISRRELTATVERERREGHPICASVNPQRPGYYLAANKGEMRRYCNTLFHRAGELHKTRRACLASLDELPGGEE